MDKLGLRLPVCLITLLLCEAITTVGTTTTNRWGQIDYGPPVTTNPECLFLEAYNHINEIKGLDACEPHHHVWRHLNDLTTTNWHCRENIIGVMRDRYQPGTSVAQYCGCKTHMWTDNGDQTKTSNTVKRTLDGINPECFKHKGCQDLKELYENDTCKIHEIVWNSLYTCPSDIFVEGQAVTCQANIVKKMFERFNGSIEQYDNDACYCYPTFGLNRVPRDCNRYGGFSRLQLLALRPNDCTTHYSVWKDLATQPLRCQNWIIDFMLENTRDDFTCGCHFTSHDVLGRSLRKRDTSILPSCEQDAQGWKAMHTTFLSNPCHSHWYVWRHVADVHGHCRQYMINEMFARFASVIPNCKCDPLSLTSTMAQQPTTTQQPTTAIPQQSCFICNGSSCATGGSSVTCGSGIDFCMTSIIDHGQPVQRWIERRCATKAECDRDDQSSNTLCTDMSKASFGVPYVCRFCCVGPDCNKSPQLKPSLETLYSYNFP